MCCVEWMKRLRTLFLRLWISKMADIYSINESGKRFQEMSLWNVIPWKSHRWAWIIFRLFLLLNISWSLVMQKTEPCQQNCNSKLCRIRIFLRKNIPNYFFLISNKIVKKRLERSSFQGLWFLSWFFIWSKCLSFNLF